MSAKLRLVRLRRHIVWLPMLLAGSLAGCGSDPPAPKKSAAVKRPAATVGKAEAPIATRMRFTDVTDAAGVRFEYRDGSEAGHYSILESLGGGAALFDFDGDGTLDLFLPGGGAFPGGEAVQGRSGALYRNLEEFRFQDVTNAAGAGAAPHYSHGAAVGDVNGDGFPDLLVTGYGGLALFYNLGDGTFVETAHAAGLTDELWSSSAAWGDVNGDGVLDLYVAHYVNWSFANHPFCGAAGKHERDVCPPRSFEALPHTLYFGNGDGTFRDASREAGLEPAGPTGKGLGVLMADVDLDGNLDIYVANDTVPNFLYRNRGKGIFDETGQQSGTALSDMATPDGSMGVDMADFNADGLPDLWVANYERESLALYRNEGNCQFLHVSRASGVTAVGSLFVSFGTLFYDFDRDGDEDAFVSNGHVIRHPAQAPVKQLPLLFENSGSRFVNVAPAAGACLAIPHLGRGVAGGDIDNDGDVDLVLAPINEPATILANESPPGTHWLRVRLIGTTSHRDAVGARLTLTTSAGVQTRQIKGGGSYLSQSEPAAFFGMPPGVETIRLTIVWPSGIRQELNKIGRDRVITSIEP
jgi:enediyne biosynthesis protein E4